MNNNRYIDIPFINRGRSLCGCDCWGLIFLFYKHKMGIQLPLLDDQYKDSEQSSLISGIVESEKPEWEKVNQPKTGNVVVLKIGGRPCHVGIYLERNRMIHTVKGINSCIERLDGPKWKNRIDGYYQKK